MFNQPIYYRDLNLDFIKHPVNGDISKLTNTESVKRSIRNLLSFKSYEKPFHPEIGSNILDMFFDLPTPIAIDSLKDNIRYIIEKYEPRVTINSININTNLDGNDIQVLLNFTVKNLQTPINFTVNLSRSR